MIVRCTRVAVIVAGLASAGCRDSNITPPPPPSTVGGAIVFASDREDSNFEIYRIGADGRALRRLTTNRDFNDRAPVLSRDGRRVAWEREVGAAGGITAVEIWTMALDGSDAEPVVRNGSFNRSPSWGPNDEIVFTSRITGSDQVYRLDAGGAEPVRLTTGGAADQNPRFSTDGQRVVFQSNRGLDFDIFVMGRDGSGVTNLTRFTGDDRFPTWTPDGLRIVWTRFDERSSTFDLYVMAADGSAPAPLITSPFNELNPSVSPDGASVVYQTDRTPPFALYVAPMAGGDGRPLRALSTARAGAELTPWWGTSP